MSINKNLSISVVLLGITIYSYSYFIDSCKRLKSAYIILVVANLVDYKSSIPIRTKRLDLTCLCFATLHYFNINSLRVTVEPAPASQNTIHLAN